MRWWGAPGRPFGSLVVGSLLVVLLIAAVSTAVAQTLPDVWFPDLRPEFAALACPEREGPVARTDAERARFDMRARYRSVLPAYFAKVGGESDAVLRMPVEGVRVAHVTDTWHAPRGGGALHEGQDIFAPRGTPIRSATSGFVYRIDDLSLGGLTVTIVGGAGRRYFYTHLDAAASDLREGRFVDDDTIIGFVGDSGNAAGTPPHLHFGVYGGEEWTCEWQAIDPLPLMIDRD
ncbi:MAG: M23 family metallopeptidase [Trueperaceae bacterium]|nr:M23 family metallopeptidase [Trueperaceae bacterium]